MKRIRTFLILTLFLVSMTGSAFAAGANTEQQTAASYLREAGIMVGYETGDMMLDQGLTRAQMAAVLTRIVTNPDHVEADSAYYRGQCKFTDVPDWAKVYVGYCAANHLVAGYKSVNEINRILAELPPEHPAKGPHGLFLKARENLWGNIIIGLGNRLAIFQDPLVDKITRNHDVDLLLPGQKPCAYFVIISAQDSTYRFLSSLFFSLTFPRLSDYARLHGGRLPVLTNFCLEEYLNIGYMEGISDVFNSIRGFNMSVQLAVQSLSQWKEKYPGTEWENQLNAFDRTIYMGCNDLTSAKYFAEKCGKVTISVTNNQFPLMPLFSPVYSSTRPYSQTRSNTQRDLLQADEFLRLDRYKCVVMFNHYKPAHLYKIMLEELPEYKQLRKCSVFDYEPEWKSREEAERQRRAPEKRSDMEETESPPNLQQSTRNPDAHGAARQAADPPVAGKPSVPQRQETGNTCIYDIPSMKNATPESIGLVEMTRSAIISSDDPELEEMDDPSRIPPGRGI